MPVFHALIVASFWVCAAGIAYTYALYPVVVALFARMFGRSAESSFSAAQSRLDLPAVSLLIAAHNEESVIEDRILNALAIDYPSEMLEIVIASDGSTDRTAAIVSRFAGRNVRLLDYPTRRGKASVLNDAMAQLLNPIVLLSDANTRTDPNAAFRLVRWFANPRVGAVCGRLIITDPSSGGNADGLYWKYETFLKKQESRLGALLGSNGAIYAIRREYFHPIPPQTIIDDFVIPLAAKIRSGCDIVYDCDAIAHEETAPDIRAEFRRRTRIGTGGWQAIAMLWPLLDPRQGWIAFTFFSHKILRWTCPFYLIAALFSNLLLGAIPFYRWLLVVQAGLYLSALAGGFVPRTFPAARVLRLANMFVQMNAALLIGFFHWVFRRQTGMWRVTERPSPSSADAAENRPELHAGCRVREINPIG